MASQRPDFPADKLRAALDDPDARKQIDALHEELASERPAPAKIRDHVQALQKHAPLQSLLVAWFDDPRTQAFIDELTAAGL